jgi:hypothetical protein
MKPSAQLKRSAIFFAIFWTAGMLWWDGSFAPANIIITATCGAVCGYAWYRAMRWQVPRGKVPSRSLRSAATAAKQ